MGPKGSWRSRKQKREKTRQGKRWAERARPCPLSFLFIFARGIFAPVRIEIPVGRIAFHFDGDMVAQPDLKLERQARAHAPGGAVKVKVGIPVRGKIDLGRRVISVDMVSPITVGRGMGGRPVAGSRTHPGAAARDNVTGGEKKRKKCAEQNNKKKAGFLHLISSLKNGLLIVLP
jgi:hypothetical protein